MTVQIKSAEIDNMPVIRDIKDFDKSSGNILERLIFNNRIILIIIAVIMTIIMGYETSKLNLNASFEKMLPTKHPYIKNYIEHKSDLRGLGNTVRVAVENAKGDIYDAQYLELLKNVNDDLFLLYGVDRNWMKSIWMPSVRWNVVTEEGFAGGPVMPDNYDGTPATIRNLKLNVNRANIMGTLVGDNSKSSIIMFALLDVDQTTGRKLEYSIFSDKIEEIRKRNEEKGKGLIKIHITGFAKIVGDLIAGLKQVMTFFAFAIIIAAVVIYIYTRCVRSMILLICCSVIAVIWQLGIITALGFDLDPYSILVPFLVFAMGVSHGAQKMNGIMQDVGRGTHKLVAARYTFRRLFLPGVTALLANAVGFAVLMLIQIPVIQDLALTASIGVAVLIFTNLILLPVSLSFVGVSEKAAERSLKEEMDEGKGKGLGVIWQKLDYFATRRSWAISAVVALVVLAALGAIIGKNVKVGDLDPGAPELRPNSRYNIDNAYVNMNYALSSDQFAVIVQTPVDGVLKYVTQIESDRLAQKLRKVEGVQAVNSVSEAIRQVNSGTSDGSPKWYSIPRNAGALNYACSFSINNKPDLFNGEGSIMPVIAYLKDHKAETLDRVLTSAADFADKHNDDGLKFMLAAGSAGIDAATNIVVKETNRSMMFYVYAAVIMLCFITFRSWRAVTIAIIPLILTSILCEALMVILGIGVKVATLPVIALGVGVGVDYALYLLSVQLGHMRAGLPLSQAYKRAVQFTGKVVALVGITLSGAVVTWAWSPIKFQADMGILLSFMFLYNMLGALVFIPALSQFILGRTDQSGEVYLRERKVKQKQLNEDESDTYRQKAVNRG